MSGDGRRPLVPNAIHMGRDEETVPMHKFWIGRVVLNIDCDGLPLLQT